MTFVAIGALRVKKNTEHNEIRTIIIWADLFVLICLSNGFTNVLEASSTNG